MKETQEDYLKKVEEKKTFLMNSFNLHPSDEILEKDKKLLLNGRVIETNELYGMSKVALPVLLTLSLGYSDLHCVLNGRWLKIKARKNGSIKVLTKKDLINTIRRFVLTQYNVNIEEIEKLFNIILGREELIFDMQNELEKSFGTNLLKEFGSIFTRDKLSFAMYKSQSTGGQIVIRGKIFDFRYEFIPTKFGEEIVFNCIIRLLDTEDRDADYGEYQEIFKNYLAGTGIFVIGGPTGSGKSTAIYSGLKELYNEEPDKAYYSVENPIEKKLDFVTQLEVQLTDNNDNTMGFGEYGKSLFRADGDTIFVGEIRDSETFNNAINLSLSGHNIFSTIHIKSSFDFFNRIQEYGRKPIEALNNTRGIITQNLIGTYKEGIKLRDLTSADNISSPLYRDLIIFKETGKNSILLQTFYNSVKKFENLIKNNRVVDKSKRDKFVKNIQTIESFNNFLLDTYYFYDVTNVENKIGRTVLFEVLVVTNENKNLILDKREEFYEKETIFLPMFINGFFSDSKIQLNELYQFSKVIY